MDYEKKYKEALKRARERHRVCVTNDLPTTKATIEAIFPELRESEEEQAIRIIKKRMCYDPVPISDEDRRIVDNWLEKQKEPHYTKRNALFDKCVENCDPEVMKEVSDKVDEMLGKEQKSEQYEIDVLKKHITKDSISELAHTVIVRNGWEIVEKEQKPDDDPLDDPKFLKGFDTGREVQRIFDEQKPVEWSEEDERMLEVISYKISQHQGNDERSLFTPDEAEFIDGMQDKLKSLRPQPHTVSIKDATKFGNLEYERGVKDGIQSEKSRQWKPSEEQMDAIDRCVDYLEESDNEDAEIMESLREQLHKLM